MNTKNRSQLHADLKKAWDSYEPQVFRCHANVIYNVMLDESTKAGADLTPSLAADLASEMALWMLIDLYASMPKA